MTLYTIADEEHCHQWLDQMLDMDDEYAEEIGWVPRKEDDEWIHVFNLVEGDVIYAVSSTAFYDTFVVNPVDTPITVVEWETKSDGFVYVYDEPPGFANWSVIIDPCSKVRITPGNEDVS